MCVELIVVWEIDGRKSRRGSALRCINIMQRGESRLRHNKIQDVLKFYTAYRHFIMLNLTALVIMRGIMSVIISNGSQRLHVAYSMLLLQDDKRW